MLVWLCSLSSDSVYCPSIEALWILRLCHQSTSNSLPAIIDKSPPCSHCWNLPLNGWFRFINYRFQCFLILAHSWLLNWNNKLSGLSITIWCIIVTGVHHMLQADFVVLGFWVVRQTTSRSKALWWAKCDFTTSTIVELADCWRQYTPEVVSCLRVYMCTRLGWHS